MRMVAGMKKTNDRQKLNAKKNNIILTLTFKENLFQRQSKAQKVNFKFHFLNLFHECFYYM